MPSAMPSISTASTSNRNKRGFILGEVHERERLVELRLGVSVGIDLVSVFRFEVRRSGVGAGLPQTREAAPHCFGEQSGIQKSSAPANSRGGEFGAKIGPRLSIKF